ncbi:ArsA family ATPase [Polyangium sorediatum]|uniref:arsenite-transporting ATPase n=1 Tax=Polyangium sorediatum TaxID=889274 RepID=A0ABT6PA67_9BACT|nr:ArsA-related P-loop ATPase [Polyangium sorediatum]MDI1437526.1 ArsA-related P-loop ATPase [Polyangium sorediatum]
MAASDSRSSSASGLGKLLDARRVLLVVGCGGVGKTTTTAALGLAAARRGKRVLCLTIDPARRLSQSLGIEEMKTEAQTIDPALFAQAGVTITGSMTVMMLDTKSTFDSLVTQLAPSVEQRDRILNNVLYKYISTSLAGTQEYMAMEKLYATKSDPSYDLILLDTPPTPNALDFLDAPERLVGAIDSAATRWLVQAVQSSGKFSINVLAKGAAAIVRGIGKVSGSGFLEQMAAFIAEINSVFGGWKKRADAVSTALRGPDVAYVLVTTPDPLAVREVMFFAERLREQDMRRDAFVVNRVHPTYGRVPDVAEVEAALSQSAIPLGPDAPARLRRAAEDESRMGKLDALHLVGLEAALEDEASGGSLLAHVPAFPYDIHDLERLSRIAEVLAP